MNGITVTKMERAVLLGLALLLVSWLLAGARPPLLHGAMTAPAAPDATETVVAR